MLSHAILDGANLSGAVVPSGHFKGASLFRARLVGTAAAGGDFAESNLIEADLRGSDLRGVNLAGAHLDRANLSNANLSGANLNGTILSQTNLAGADLSGTDLSGAEFTYGANLSGVIYEPQKSPYLKDIHNSTGLGYLTWRDDSGPILMLRSSLRVAGFSDAARQVTAAIHRHGQSRLERLLFDQTCEWGANWLRPLYLFGALSLICAVIYWVGMHFGKRSGLYLVATGQRIRTGTGKERVFRIPIRSPHRAMPISEQRNLDHAPKRRFTVRLLRFRRALGRELASLGTAFLFSMMSAFNIGFREFNFGLWIRMVQPREFDIRAHGWMRTVSGIQSLLGIALVALSLLSYFGHPFE